jgi:hypothetical protein
VLDTADGAGIRLALACFFGAIVLIWLSCSIGFPSAPWACATMF